MKAEKKKAKEAEKARKGDAAARDNMFALLGDT